MTPADASRQRRVWALLVAMTIATLGGPVGIWAVLRGGKDPRWPPDRAVEWATFAGICALVVALMVLAVAVAVANQRAARRLRESAGDRPAGNDRDAGPI